MPDLTSVIFAPCLNKPAVVSYAGLNVLEFWNKTIEHPNEEYID